MTIKVKTNRLVDKNIKEKAPKKSSGASASELRVLAHKLGERVKELNCLYGISRLVEVRESSVEEVLRGVVDLIPPAWQYSDVTCGRISLKDKQYVTTNFKQTKWRQAESIFVNGERFGEIEIYYLEEKPESDEGPFLKEERNLIHIIAERTGHVIERKIAEISLLAHYEQEKELRQKLQAQMQWRNEFTRNLIHELKTPLTSLVATSQLLLEEEKNKKLANLARYVYESASNLDNRIDELHDVIRGEIGKLKFEPKPLTLEPLLASLRDETRALARQYEVTVNLKVPNFLPEIYADAGRVRQIVLNLLNNAFKYAADGGEVNMIVTAKSPYVMVEIQDKGPGISAEEQEHLFQPGYQTEHPGVRSGGLGIGLALCKLLTELHGGKIWVRSRTGKGASFFFTLPLLKEV
jgi:signal transduction histidine kinase